MQNLFHFIQQQFTDSYDTIVVVGAGSGSHLNALRGFSCKRLVLTEAHPNLAHELAHEIHPEKGEIALHAAITALECEQAKLHLCNNPIHSSLVLPQELTNVAPNLRITDHTTVPALPFATLLEELHLEDEKNNILVLNAPGQNAQLLQSIPLEFVQKFSWIIIQGGVIANLYHDDLSLEDTAALLQELGFDCIEHDPESLFPFDAIAVQRNPLSARALQLTAALATVTSERDSLADENLKLAEELANQCKLTSEQTTTLEQQIHELRKAREAQDTLTAEQQHALEAMTAERSTLACENTNLAIKLDEHNKLVNKQRANVQALTKERDALQQQINELKFTTEKLDTLVTEQQSDLLALTKQCDSLANEKETLTKYLDDQKLLANERQASNEALTKERDALLKQKNELIISTQERDTLAEEKNTLAKNLNDQRQLANKLRASIEALTKERDALLKQKNELIIVTKERDTLAEEKNTLTKNLDDQRQLANKLQSCNESLTKERDTLLKQKNELKISSQELNELVTERQTALLALTKERDAARAESQGKDKRIAQLEMQQTEQEHRQQLLQVDLLKAEAQIELIKDLMLREPGL